jgi:hypothetical protein
VKAEYWIDVELAAQKGSRGCGVSATLNQRRPAGILSACVIVCILYESNKVE